MAKKACIKCKRKKDIRQFTRDSRRPGKRLGRCKQCRREASVEWRKKNPEKCRTTPEIRRERGLRLLYKLTPESFEAMWVAQRGLCALCRRPMKRGGKTALSVTIDHDHLCCPGERTCGDCIRGLIHHSCNRLLGVANDDADVLKAAVRYLVDWLNFLHTGQRS